MSGRCKSDGATQYGKRSDVTLADPWHGGGSAVVFWLQGATILWMTIECGVSLYAAFAARSVVLAAFGSDSFVELLSSALVLLQWFSREALSERSALRAAGALLFVLAAIVSALAIGELVFGVVPEVSRLGIGITIAALGIMPFLAAMKRREARRSGNAVLAADAVQSATCAYLAAVTLTGLLVNALFHLAWFDAAAALVAVPLLLREAREAWKGKGCGCC